MTNCMHEKFVEQVVYETVCRECGETQTWVELRKAEERIRKLEAKLTDGGVYVEAEQYQRVKAENQRLREAATELRSALQDRWAANGDAELYKANARVEAADAALATLLREGKGE